MSKGVTEHALQEAAEIEATPDRSNLRRMIVLIGMGLFITTAGQPRSIGQLPFQHLLKDEMHLEAVAVSGFWAFSNLAWYFKPLAGILCDSIPIFGTRRKWYLILSALFAGLLWLAYLILPRTYNAYMINTLLIAVFMVIASTVVGGIMVEVGQRHGMTGRLSSFRSGLEGVMSLIMGPLGGYFATRSFGIMVGFGTALLLSLVPAAFFFVREGNQARVDVNVWQNAKDQFSISLRSRTMWWAVFLIFLVYLSPGFGTALYYYQTDTLKFDNQFIGNLGVLSGCGAILGAIIYGFLCKRLSLRPLLFLGIIFNVISTMFYLKYDSRQAAMILEFASGMFSTIGVLPLFDLAARATPKGSESFGFSLMMSVRNVTLLVISDVLGSYIYTHNGKNFLGLVWINAITTFFVLFAVPLLPRSLMDKTDR